MNAHLAFLLTPPGVGSTYVLSLILKHMDDFNGGMFFALLQQYILIHLIATYKSFIHPVFLSLV